jgi:malonyl-CoA/methylmalonyl-CoA synthetase
LLQAWEYAPSDRLLHVLPLHHIHGVVNALLTPLFAGSTIEFLFPFHASSVWTRLAQPFLPPTSEPVPQPFTKPITFLTVVPTIYTRLLSSHEQLSKDIQTAAQKATSPANLRLNISGSAALPTPVKKSWETITGGNVLLERYGMTEVGMALSCGLKFESRVDGSVGWPLPGVEARLVDLETGDIISENEARSLQDQSLPEKSGEIQLRGETIFKEYWRNPEATARDFVKAEDGGPSWFRTGDVAVRRVVKAAEGGQDWTNGPLFFILGRSSADIIKTGGEKVSALEVEREMLSLEQVDEVAVVALPSEAWGQKVASIVVLSEKGKTAGKAGKQWSPLDMRRALKDKLANYKIPQEMKVVESIPRNAMGKSKSFLPEFDFS